MVVTAGPLASVVLARGLGRRMREVDAATELEAAQERVAEAGQKGMMPIGSSGRPFLDYVLSTLADAGLSDVILVVAPDHEAMRAHYDPSRLSRMRVRFAVQPDADGTARAVLAAEPLLDDRPFLALNADNLYPVDVLRALAALDGPGVPAFERRQLVEESGFPESRVGQFAVLHVNAEGWLTGIEEKPDPRDLADCGPGALISMNVWRFDHRIFDACRDVQRSERGEYELPEAVGLAVSRGVLFRALRARGAVLDLSRRGDVARVSAQLHDLEPRL
jgi:glucose-1-phosphate thymidylyltransferase